MGKVTSRGYWVLSAAVALGLLVAACGGGEDEEAPQPTTPPAATSRPAATAAPTATAVLVPTGQFRFAIDTLRGFDLQIGLNALAAWTEPLYDNIIGGDANGKLNPDQGLAKSWEGSADGKTWTLNLRDNVVFHNGDRATSQDVKFAIEWGKTESKLTHPDFPRFAKTVTAVETPDAATVIVRLQDRDILFAEIALSRRSEQAGMLFSKKHVESVGLEGANKNPVGSGPYKAKSVSVGNNIVYEALDRHWYYGVPKYKTVEYRLIPEPLTRVALLKANEVELALTSVDDAAGLRAAGFDVKSSPGARRTYVLLHDQHKSYPGGDPFGNVKVRKALGLAVDRKALVETFMRGLATPGVSLVSPISPIYEAYPIPDQDLKGARTLLQEAGYPNGFAVDFLLAPWGGKSEEIGEAVAGWWEQIGLKVTRVQVDVGRHVQLWAAHNFKGPTAGIVSSGAEAYSGLYTAADKASLYHVTSADDLVSLGKQAAQAATVDEFIRLTKQIQSQLIERALQQTLFYYGNIYAVRRGYGGDRWELGGGTGGGYSINIRALLTTKPF